MSRVTDSLPTQVLIERVQQGDLVAREMLYDRCLLPVLFLVRVNLGRKLRTKVESWDIVQETLLRSLRDLDGFRPEHSGAFHRYLAKKVDQVILDQVDYWTAAKRTVDREESLDAATMPVAERVLDNRQRHSPSERLILNEDLNHLAAAMDELAETAPDDWDVIVAIKLLGGSLRDVADSRGTSIEAVKMKQRRAMLKLTKIFRLQEQLRNGAQSDGKQ